MFRVPGMYNFAARMCCCIWPTCGKPGKWHKKPNGNIDIGVIKQPCCLCCHIWADTGTHFLLHLRISNLAVPHLVEWIPNAYGPRRFGPPKWVPNLLVPLDKQSPPNSVPKNLVSMEKWSPTNLFPMDKWSLEYSICPREQGPNWLGTICVQGDQLCWGPFVQGDIFYGDCLSRGIGSGGPEMGDRKSGDQMS